ncbi:HAD hydrolase family protein [Natronosporangium hydrolyticum]|uniref:HAD hydrolase family protein n=1 Tax=Natronosporangium hydrolyticum TaxID=2811111 RepID=A0A895YHX0_9ACTN|nr:HAD hydrolase family protein [Natronosporangium hydrolyticum]QSB14953.1 HAD hydrolase family protein [Natronosporangium hydrolyticum]
MPRPRLPKLIATDLDGTLVRSDDTVSAYTHQVLDRVKAAGVPVVGATGRGPRLRELSQRDLPHADYLVLGGGSHVVDLRGSDSPVTVHDQRLEGPVAAALLDDLSAEVGPLLVMVEGLDHQYAPLWGDLDPDWPWPQRVVAMPRTESLAGPVIKAFARAVDLTSDELLAVAQQVIPPEKASVTQAGLGFVEICPPGADKAAGLAVVVEVLGIDPAEVLVFGDMPNDIPMFGWAGWGAVAMSNAHPSVLTLANEVTLSNDEDGVAVYLDRLFS